MKAHWEWLERRRSTEAEIAAYSVAEGNQIVRPDTHSPSRDIDDSNNAASAPRPNDVLFGRGTRVVNHPGNQYLSRMVEEYAARYDASEKLDKHCLVHFLVTKVRDSSGRFLRQQDLDDHWEEVNEKDAHQKVAYTFRNFRQTIIKRR